MKNKKRPVILITGGHSTGIALVEEIQKTHPQWQIIYLGRKHSLEGKAVFSFEWHQLAERKDLKFLPITSGRLQRKFTKSTIPSLLKIPIGFLQSLIIIKTHRPTATVSFGGYVSTPVVIASWLLAVPVISHEQTSSIGLANKINSLFSKKIAVSFPNTLKDIPKNKAVYTGNLISDLVKNKTNPASLGWLKKEAQNTKKPILYITGGKTGSSFINELVRESLTKLVKNYIVVHQTGGLEYEKHQKIKMAGYYPLEILPFKQQGWILNNAKIIVSRGGANIVFELATIGKPAIIIPIPWSSGNEQFKNCQFLSEIGLAVCLDQNKVSPNRFLKSINQLSQKIDKGLTFKKEKIKNGRIQLVAEIEKLINEKNS
jgi:UDP-N-acetylglucosamine--N-acetylmuramyl-(pentapeptide) pyrophosphoryl-undecaprenol N-acetylglucosamine transferase